MKTSFRHVAIAALVMTGAYSVATVAPAVAQSQTGDEQIHRALLAHPEWIAEAMNSLQQKQQQDRVSALLGTAKPVSDRIIAGDKQISFLGNPKGTKHVVEYFDYNCGYCKKFATETATPLLAKDKDVKLYLVHTPILGPGSERMAEFAAAAQIQGKFAPAHEFLIAQHATTVEAANALQGQLVSTAGLDKAAFDKALTNGTAKAIVDHNSKLSQQAGVSGTPMIYANGKVAPGAIPMDALEQYLAS
jgi:protein-disulfide isomerase